MIPGASVPASPPWRRAIRCTTRSVYSSSSLVPVSIWITIETAAITSAASSASPNEPIVKKSGKTSSVSMERAGVGEQHQQEADDQRERQPQRRDQGREEGVDDRDYRRDQEGASRVLDCHAGDERRRDVNRPGRHGPRGDESHRAQARFGGLPPDLGAEGAIRHGPAPAQ